MSWDEEAANWDDNPAVRAYADAAFTSLVGVLGAKGGALRSARVLDFGCGTGLLATRIADAGAEVVALDVSEPMVAKLRAKDHPRVKPVVGLLEDIVDTEPFQSPFDVIVASSVCAFLEDYPRTARHLADLLTPGGVFVQWDWPRDPADSEGFGLDRATIGAALLGAGLQRVTVDVGFEVEHEGHTMAPLRAVGFSPPHSAIDFTKMINDRLSGHGRALGMKFTKVHLDEVVVEVPVAPHLKQPFGMVHGGVYCSIAESLCSVGAGVNVIASGRTAVGLDNHTSFVHAVREGTIHGRATPIHRGNRFHVWAAELRDDNGRLVAQSRVQLAVLESGAHLAGATVTMKE